MRELKWAPDATIEHPGSGFMTALGVVLMLVGGYKAIDTYVGYQDLADKGDGSVLYTHVFAATTAFMASLGVAALGAILFSVAGGWRARLFYGAAPLDRAAGESGQPPPVRTIEEPLPDAEPAEPAGGSDVVGAVLFLVALAVIIAASAIWS